MPQKTPKVFIDTNVWFSAFYGSVNCEKILKSHVERRIEAVLSQKVVKELIKNVRKKFPSAFSEVRIFLESYPPEIVKNSSFVSTKVKKLVNPKDQLIFQSALDAKVKIFVTGNVKHFKRDEIEKKLKVKILTPKQAVDKLGF